LIKISTQSIGFGVYRFDEGLKNIMNDCRFG